MTVPLLSMSQISAFRVLAPLLLATSLASPPLSAQHTPPDIDAIFNWSTPDAPGCTCAVSQHGQLLINRAFGAADLERRVPLTPDSRFDVASVRKQFIAAAILMLVEEGKLALDDDVRKHIPELPDYGHTITLDHLLTHTSGLRDWTGLQMLAGNEVDVLTLILRQRALNFAPGEEWSYSNSGYVLLKEIVVRTSGTTFPEFTRTRMFEPLGMTNTAYYDDLEEVIENRALAYAKAPGGWKQDMRIGHDRGSGGALFSTARDMVIWNDALTGRRLGQFVGDKLEETVTLNNGRKLNYARGLIVRALGHLQAVVHTGGAGGYSTWVGRLPGQGLSVAVLCNADSMGTSGLANRILDQYLPANLIEQAEQEEAAMLADAVELSEADLRARAGVFFSNAASEPLRLVVNGGRLRIMGGPALVAIANDRFRNPSGNIFFMSQDELELRFVSDDELELKTMEGETTTYRRAQPPRLTEDELKAFAGRYSADEIGTVFEIVPQPSGLVMRFERSPEKAIPFTSIAPDTFQVSRMLIRFQRDAAGNITGFDYTNPVLRSLRFTRLTDRN